MQLSGISTIKIAQKKRWFNKYSLKPSLVNFSGLGCHYLFCHWPCQNSRFSKKNIINQVNSGGIDFKEGLVLRYD